jgi:hypothetical protein
MRAPAVCPHIRDVSRKPPLTAYKHRFCISDRRSRRGGQSCVIEQHDQREVNLVAPLPRIRITRRMLPSHTQDSIMSNVRKESQK